MKTALLVSMFLLLTAVAAYPHPNYQGYSGGQPGRMTCAMSCHGADGASISVQGFPAVYIPGQTYMLSISRIAGDPVSNFNISIRVGTDTANAGLITSGDATSTYNVPGETNGVHFTTPNQISGTFNWTAPPSGTGTVRLYGGAHQGSSDFGPNTEFLQISHETPRAPGQATQPLPPDSAAGVPLNAQLSWTADTAATSHDIYFGATNPPDSVTNTTVTVYAPVNLQPGTLYFWRVDERNAAGVTEGTVWRFTTTALPEAATNPVPSDNAVNVPINTVLNWTAGADAESHDVYFGTVISPPFRTNVSNGTSYMPGALNPGTAYYWRIDERNSAGVTTGVLWHFTTQVVSAADSPGSLPEGFELSDAYPNPFNSSTSISFSIPATAQVRLRIFSVSGEQVATLVDDIRPAGQYRFLWDPKNLGSGTYYYQLETGGFSQSKRVLLIR